MKISLVDFARADAGNPEAHHDLRLSYLHTAYKAAFQAGQKTPLLTLQRQCALYATPKDCRVLTDTPDRTTPQATKACKVYQAYKLALDAVGIPSKTEGDHDAMAMVSAGEFVALLTTTLTPEVIDDATKAANKAARDAAKAKAAADVTKAQAAITKAKVDAALADAAKLAPTMDDMVRIVAQALASGTLSTDQYNAIAEASEAASTAEMAALLAAQGSTATPTPAHA